MSLCHPIEVVDLNKAASRSRTEIAIVGAGFSGSLLALQILRADTGARVFLIEQAAQFGRGLAYGTADPSHLLNVRAANMSAFPEEPDHFLSWLRLTAHGRDAAPTFVSRQLYGTYLQALLGATVQTEKGAGRLIAIGDEAVSLSFADGRVRLRLALGRDLDVDVVVLATGNLPPHDLPALIGAERPIYESDPWSEGALADLDAHDDVLLVGTGLTAIDMVLRLKSRGHRGSIQAMSRRGLRPHRHENPTPSMRAWQVPARPSLATLLGTVRDAAKMMGWREAVDGLRPSVQRLWRDASLAERRRFLRHLRPWWDIHRHRIAPEVATAVDQLVADGRLSFLAGRIEDVCFDRQGAIVTWVPRGGNGRRALQVQRIVNCTGPAGNLARCRSPLLRDLFACGYARPDACELGLDVDEHCRLLNSNGDPQSRLLAVGPLSRGSFWEITSVPDIRVQATQVAGYLRRNV